MSGGLRILFEVISNCSTIIACINKIKTPAHAYITIFKKKKYLSNSRQKIGKIISCLRINVIL